MITENMVRAKKSLRNQRRVKKLGLVGIDYPQLTDGVPYETRDDELAKVVIAMKNMVIKLDVPVFLMSQLERELEYREKQTSHVE